MIAVVVPDGEYLTAWARDRGIEGDMKTLCANEVGCIECIVCGYTYYAFLSPLIVCVTV